MRSPLRSPNKRESGSRIPENDLLKQPPLLNRRIVVANLIVRIVIVKVEPFEAWR